MSFVPQCASTKTLRSTSSNNHKTLVSLNTVYINKLCVSSGTIVLSGGWNVVQQIPVTWLVNECFGIYVMPLSQPEPGTDYCTIRKRSCWLLLPVNVPPLPSTLCSRNSKSDHECKHLFILLAFTASLKLKYYFSDLFCIFITIRPYNCRNEEVFVFLKAVLETRQGIRRQSSNNFHGVYTRITLQHNLVTPTVCASRYTWISFIWFMRTRSGVYNTIIQLKYNNEDDSKQDWESRLDLSPTTLYQLHRVCSKIMMV